MVRSDRAAVTGVCAAIARLAQPIQYHAVIGTERAGGGVYPEATDALENLAAAFEFVSESVRRELSPRDVGSSVASDTHPMRPQFTDVIPGKKRWLIQAAR